MRLLRNKRLGMTKIKIDNVSDPRNLICSPLQTYSYDVIILLIREAIYTTSGKHITSFL